MQTIGLSGDVEMSCHMESLHKTIIPTARNYWINDPSISECCFFLS